MSSKISAKEAILPFAVAFVAGGVYASMALKRAIDIKRKEEETRLEETKLQAFYKLENARNNTTGSDKGKTDTPFGTLLSDVSIDKVYCKFPKLIFLFIVSKILS